MWSKIFQILAITISVLMVVLIGAIWIKQESMLFVGAHIPMPPVESDIEAFKFSYIASDGTPIQAWLMPPTKTGAPKALLVYFPGNYEQASWFIKEAAPRLAAEGLAIGTLNYRGFGGNPGIPGEASLISDAEGLVKKMASKYPNVAIYFVGRSLGSGVASLTYAALHKQPLGKQLSCLSLITPFAKIADPASSRFYWMPEFMVESLLRHPFNSKKALENVRFDHPVSISISGNDKLIPFGSSIDLARGIKSPNVEIDVMPHATHSSAMTGPIFWNKFYNFALNDCKGLSVAPTDITKIPQTLIDSDSKEKKRRPSNAVSSKGIESQLQARLPNQAYLSVYKSNGSSESASIKKFFKLDPSTTTYLKGKDTASLSNKDFSGFLNSADQIKVDAHFLRHLEYVRSHSGLPQFLLPKDP